MYYKQVLVQKVITTAVFSAPEILKGYSPTRKSDVWSVGVLAYVL